MSAVDGHTFDWRPSFDERSRNYPVRTMLAPTGVPVGQSQPRSAIWRCPAVLDQGPDGACVGFGWSGELMATPAAVKGVTNRSALDLYHQAQTLDEWPGENYEGTSVLAGAKAVMADGYMTQYRWAFSGADIVQTLGWHGPVVVGWNWREGMMDPDADGLVHATGQVVGGHCVMLRGVFIGQQTVMIQNSWGESWGKRGCAYLPWADLGRLLDDQGEQCVPVHRTLKGV